MEEVERYEKLEEKKEDDKEDGEEYEKSDVERSIVSRREVKKGGEAEGVE